MSPFSTDLDWSPALRYLIDGNNLLHAVHAQGRGPAVGREGLCKLVAGWARRCRAEVTLVFDGFTPRTGLAQQLQQPGITVRFSGPRSADTVIENDVAESATPAEITVVTTDRAIQHEVRYRRARTVDSDAFVAELYPPPPDRHPPAPRPPEKPDQISPHEANEWLDHFGDHLEDLADDDLLFP